MYKKISLLFVATALISCSPYTSENPSNSNQNQQKIEVCNVFSWINDVTKENFVEFSYCFSGIASNPFTVNRREYVRSKEKYEQLISIKNSYLIPAEKDYLPVPGGHSKVYSFSYLSDNEIKQENISIQNNYIYINKNYYMFELAENFNFNADYTYLHFCNSTPNEIEIYDCSSNELLNVNFNFHDIEFIEISKSELSNEIPKFYTENYDNPIYYYSKDEFSVKNSNVNTFYKVVSDKNFYFFE